MIRGNSDWSAGKRNFLISSLKNLALSFKSIALVLTSKITTILVEVLENQGCCKEKLQSLEAHYLKTVLLSSLYDNTAIKAQLFS